MPDVPADASTENLRVATDTVLAERAADGDTAAFQTLIGRHGQLMRAYAARILGSAVDADDVVQEAFYIAWRKLPQLHDPAAVKAWLMRIVSRQAITFLRRAPKEDLLPALHAASSSDTQPEATAVRNAQLRALSTSLDTLTPDLRHCWLLREVAGLSYEQIANDMDVTPSTVRGKLARARAKIVEDMGGWR